MDRDEKLLSKLEVVLLLALALLVRVLLGLQLGCLARVQSVRVAGHTDEHVVCLTLPLEVLDIFDLQVNLTNRVLVRLIDPVADAPDLNQLIWVLRYLRHFVGVDGDLLVHLLKYLFVALLLELRDFSVLFSEHF